jgi:Fe-S-cluster containining protein
MSASFAEAAQRAGEHLLCKPGCSQCCHGAFVLSPLDTLRLRAGMEVLRSTEPDLAREIEHRASMWLVEHEAGFPGKFENFANEAPCPALDTETGRCDVYKWRPMTCRLFGPPVRMGEGQALAHCELCFKGASEAEVAACEMEVPFDVEADLLAEIESKDETVVAFALLRP